jgi:hypothetical protein
MNHSAVSPTSMQLGNLRRKIASVIWSLRLLAIAYMLWALWAITQPVREGNIFLKRLGDFWQRDLTAGQVWQSWSAVSIGLVLWVILALAMWHWWNALGQLLKNGCINQSISALLRRGAWMGLACSGAGIALRPLQSYFYTAHLASDLQLWKWAVFHHDLLGMLACGVVLMLAYMTAWMNELAEENKGFV